LDAEDAEERRGSGGFSGWIADGIRYQGALRFIAISFTWDLKSVIARSPQCDVAISLCWLFGL
jgi:hypothetical protein